MAMATEQITRINQAVILCGGLGTRLMPYTKNTPKPMIECNGKPFLFYLLQQLHSQGIVRFVLLTGYLSEKIINYFGDGSKWGWDISYSDGPVDWDTGKRIWDAQSKFDARFMLLYSDNFVPFVLNKILAVHDKNQKSLTLMVTPRHQGNVALKSNIVKKYDNSRCSDDLNYVEIGYMIIEREKVLDYYRLPDCSFSEVIERMVSSGDVAAWIQNDNYHSISDPKRFKVAEEYLNFKKIILIDRDGVINTKAEQGEYISSWKEFEWIIDTRHAMKILAKKGFKFIVISNQAGIAREMVAPSELEKIHTNMKKELFNDGIEILDIYICPHHWNDSCLCRKPNPGMIHQASHDWLLRLDKTLFIGDDPRDCQASYNAGCKSILVADSAEKEKLSYHEQPIFSNTRLTECISNILDFFNKDNINDNY
jgi:histidinol-phosphate phosphatase family protein|tara:strand:- start:326 stop:1597 length:1272 start_codon:yes stop_codon:yes gene_type:complete